MLAEESVAVDEESSSLVLSVVIADESEAATADVWSSATVAGTWRPAVGKMNESDERVESGDLTE